MNSAAAIETAQPDIHSARVLILDFGAQYTQLIARRVRELQVYCEIHRPDLSAEKIRAFAPKGIILSGSPSSVEQAGAPFRQSKLRLHPARALFIPCRTTEKVLGQELG